MSEVKVNKISPRTNCGTVQLGDSGDTITIPAGATITNNGTQTGFGRTGTVDWDTTPKTASFTAESGDGYFVNTTSGVVTVTLPAGSAGDIVSLADYAATWQTNNVTVTPNGTDKIGSLNENAVLSTEGQSVTFVFVDSTQGWINTMDSTSNVRGTPPFICATGGTITECGNCRIHTFTGPGTFTVNRIATCNAPVNNLVSYVVVAGGGSGGGGQSASDNTGGGGGAGGFREVVSPGSPYTGSPLDGYPSSPNRITVTATAFPITVGAGGGPVGCTSRGNNGSNSVFSTITAAGGGGGASAHPSPTRAGKDGGSGGGASGGTSPAASGGAGNTPPVSPAQGSRGGNYCTTAPDHASPGGGGATATGFDKPGGICGLSGGPGGSGATTSIPGTATGFAGGGGGGAGICGCASNNTQFPNGKSPSPGIGQGDTLGFGGAAGGRSRSFGGAAGTANKGGGGGGGGGRPPGGPSCTSIYASGAGGSGIVIIRYKFQ
jgi:hypothetical protein